jgi:hypothetical protein
MLVGQMDHHQVRMLLHPLLNLQLEVVEEDQEDIME